MRIALFALLVALNVACTSGSRTTPEPAPTAAESTPTAPAATAPAATAPDVTAAPAPAADVTTLRFDHTTHDFGTIAEGEKVSHRYTFTNTGSKPLTIANVKPSCGCTTPDWTKSPVEPGQAGYIIVEFDSKGRPGVASKTVEVTANVAERVIPLNFTAEVTPAKK